MQVLEPPSALAELTPIWVVGHTLLVIQRGPRREQVLILCSRAPGALKTPMRVPMLHFTSAQVMVELGAKLCLGGGRPCSPCMSPLGVRACLGGGHCPDFPVSLQKICLKTRREPEPSVELCAHVLRGSFHRRSRYAFSHQEGYAGLITRGDSLRARATHRAPQTLLCPEMTPALSSLPSPSA